MELTKQQLLQIDNYIYVCGIKYYDVRTEIVDHFANILEQKLDKNPNLNLKKEIVNIHRNFSGRGFSKLLKQKTKSRVKEVAFNLIKLYAKRKAEKGFQFSPDSYLQTELEASFLYEDTPDQAKATEDFKKDILERNWAA